MLLFTAATRSRAPSHQYCRLYVVDVYLTAELTMPEPERLTFIHDEVFAATYADVIGEDGLVDLENRLIDRPGQGAVVAGTGGARKIRCATDRGGKSYGTRVIYYYRMRSGAILLILCYDKRFKKNLDDEDKANIREIIRSHDAYSRCQGAPEAKRSEGPRGRGGR